jgi:hypothetical protein
MPHSGLNCKVSANLVLPQKVRRLRFLCVFASLRHIITIRSTQRRKDAKTLVSLYVTHFPSASAVLGDEINTRLGLRVSALIGLSRTLSGSLVMSRW